MGRRRRMPVTRIRGVDRGTVLRATSCAGQDARTDARARSGSSASRRTGRTQPLLHPGSQCRGVGGALPVARDPPVEPSQRRPAWNTSRRDPFVFGAFVMILPSSRAADWRTRTTALSRSMWHQPSAHSSARRSLVPIAAVTAASISVPLAALRSLRTRSPSNRRERRHARPCESCRIAFCYTNNLVGWGGDRGDGHGR